MHSFLDVVLEVEPDLNVRFYRMHQIADVWSMVRGTLLDTKTHCAHIVQN